MFVTISTSIYGQFPSKAERAFVNGKHLYYEVYGKGEPLILLHGYTLSSRMWSAFVEDFYEEYTIYMVDLTGNGKSDEFTEDLSVQSVGADLDALLAYLKLTKVKAIGFSFGGDVLFQLAIRNPSLIESMITIGAVGTWDVNNHQNYLQAFTFEQKDNFAWMNAYHSSQSQVRALFEQFKNYRVRVTDEELKNIQADVLLMFGDDDDGIQLQEAFRARKYLPYSDLWI
ncbi:MAG: alpha/beta hydrolase, partial [Bacteroidota bacterium]